jgi:hypothetical protein
MNTPPEPHPNPGRKRTAVAVVAAVIAAVAIGTPLAAGADADAPPIVRGSDAATAPELGDVTLDDLADRLADLDLDLELTINPSADHATDPGSVDLGPGPADPGDAADDDALEHDVVDDDPFAGMSDDEIDALSDEEFFALLDKAEDDWDDEWDDDPGSFEDEFSGDFNDDDFADDLGEESPAASFAVTGDALDPGPASDGDVAAAGAIWDRFTSLIPADQRRMVVRFELMPAAYDGAYVYPSDDDPTTWVLGVSEGLGADLDFVLIHEFGHLLTLQAREVPPGGDEVGCPTYFTGEGCALKGSTFAAFVARFWPVALRDEAEDWQAAEVIYDREPDSFVSDYAATNPGEDLAETFAVFVTTDRPTGSTIADEKIRFLWDDDDMVDLRAEIRAAQSVGVS